MTETPEITPALTPEEWANRRIAFAEPTEAERRFDDWDVGYHFDVDEVVHDYVNEGCDRGALLDRRHALAAMALYGQTFGFTREDVEVIGGALECIRRENAAGAFAFYEPRLLSLLDRIAALLPPP